MSTAIGCGISTGVFGGDVSSAAPIPASWNCITPGNCLDPGDGTGTYSTLAACETACPAPPPLLLNTYPGAAAAYSLRLLDNTYAGSAIRVRRSSDSTEQDIGFSSGELDTATLLTFAGAGDAFVSTWYDQSGNANNATQSVQVDQPQIVLGGAVIVENGNPTLQIGDGYMDADSSISFTSDYFISSVFNTNTTQAFNMLLGSYNDTQSFLSLRTDEIKTRNSTGLIKTFGGVATGLSYNKQHLLTLSRASNSLQPSVDGNVKTAQTTSGTYNYDELFSYSSGNAGFRFGGNCQEIIMYGIDQLSNRTGIETNIDTFYSIPSGPPLLLNTYSGAAAAYSLRLLDNTYTGSAIRVRRSSDNTEQDIGFSSGELDTATLLTFAGAGDAFVKTWYDQSGNSNDAAQASTAIQPEIVSSGAVILKNGKPAVYFSSSSFILESTSATLFNGRIQNELYCVSSYDTINAGNQYAGGVQIGGGTRGIMIGTNSSGSEIRYHADVATFEVATGGTISAGTQLLNGGTYDGTTRDARLDQVVVGTNTDPGSTGTADVYFIGKHPSLTGGTSKHVQEMILYSSYYGNETGIETNINTFYSIPSPTPPPASGFKFSVDTTQSGGTSTDFKLPTKNTGTYNFVVDWGDGTTDTITSYNQLETTHDYGTSGIYTVECLGTYDGIQTSGTNRNKIIEVFNWGGSNLEVGGSTFGISNTLNLISSATDSPGVTGNCQGMFFGSGINGGIGGWDMSSATSCQYLCYVARSFNDDLSGWDVSSITSFDNAFNQALMSTANYDALLIAWAPQTVNSLTFSIGSTQYTAGGAAAAARATLVSKGWTITDGGAV